MSHKKLQALYKKHAGCACTVIKDVLVDVLIKRFNGSAFTMVARAEECKLVKSNMIQTVEFLDLCGITIPMDVIRIMLSYVRSRDIANGFGYCSHDTYNIVNWTWERMTICNERALYDYTVVALYAARSIHVKCSLSRKAWVYMFARVDPVRLRVLRVQEFTQGVRCAWLAVGVKFTGVRKLVADLCYDGPHDPSVPLSSIVPNVREIFRIPVHHKLMHVESIGTLFSFGYDLVHAADLDLHYLFPKLDTLTTDSHMFGYFDKIRDNFSSTITKLVIPSTAIHHTLPKYLDIVVLKINSLYISSEDAMMGLFTCKSLRHVCIDYMWIRRSDRVPEILATKMSGLCRNLVTFSAKMFIDTNLTYKKDEALRLDLTISNTCMDKFARDMFDEMCAWVNRTTRVSLLLRRIHKEGGAEVVPTVELAKSVRGRYRKESESFAQTAGYYCVPPPTVSCMCIDCNLIDDYMPNDDREACNSELGDAQTWRKKNWSVVDT